MKSSIAVIILSVVSSFCLIQAQTIVPVPDSDPTLTSSTASTTLICQRCVADGIGQAILQEECDNGAFDKFCDAGECFCPTTTRRANIKCESGACLDLASLRVTTVLFDQTTVPNVKVLKFQVQALVYDQEQQSAGDCDAITVVKATVRKVGAVAQETSKAQLTSLVEKAMSESSPSGGFICEDDLRRIALEVLLAIPHN